MHWIIKIIVVLILLPTRSCVCRALTSPMALSSDWHLTNVARESSPSVPIHVSSIPVSHAPTSSVVVPPDPTSLTRSLAAPSTHGPPAPHGLVTSQAFSPAWPAVEPALDGPSPLPSISPSAWPNDHPASVGSNKFSI